MRNSLLLSLGIAALSCFHPVQAGVPKPSTAVYEKPWLFYTAIYQKSIYCFQDRYGERGYEIWLHNNNPSKAYAVTIQVEQRYHANVTYSTRVVNIPAGGDIYIGCTVSGIGPSNYIGYSYQVVGES
ncbi:hypothetical protein [Chitinophaga nivalis]|uniref:Ig-like domain-containing protein n=1 Tax=Chitinophaga nivalis TaxID=2991709 RepID=A0ABT3IKG8_9BACT|nr:hypothetical protein [Chitinophaga nivalis]MCW3465893.1 hypothetical protein [Chitinophaga nivalis]MCW3484416.1 hypothetical protein [Chitinophaga nivalis]